MRLFIAIDVQPDIKAGLLRLAGRVLTDGAEVRWSRADQIHLTLKFVGEVADELLAPISEVVRRTAQQAPAFDLQIGGAGCFPPAGPVRIVWVGGHDPSGTLLKAVQGLEDGLEPLGVARETRTFSEHFTIGRVKFDRSRGKLREAVQAAAWEGGRQRVTELVLYQSMLSKGSAQYTPVLRAALAV